MSKDKQDLKKKDVVQAVIIDDLLSSDLSPKGCKIPKSLLPLANIPVLDYALSCLSAVGVEETLLYIAINSPVLDQHLKSSNWNKPGSMMVKVVVCEGCQSFGDLMRDLDSSNVIQGDFILLFADTICTANLKPLLEKHKSTCLKDKNAVITMVYSQLLPGHAARCLENELVLGLDNNRIISQQKVAPHESLLPVSMELLQGHSNIELRYDLLDPSISICSLTVPPIFSDNFDFQTRDDFVKGLLLNEDILGHTMYAHVLEDSYAARACNLASYLATSCDVLKRWTFPLTPDASFSLVNGSYFYDIMGNSCKQAGVKIGRSKIMDSVLGSGTKIGNNCEITMSVIGKNCSIGDNVKLNRAILWDNCSVESGYNGNHVLAHSKTNIKKSGAAQTVPLPHQSKTEKARFQECYDSETDSSDDEEFEGGVATDEYDNFFAEVQDSLARGFIEKLDTDDLVVEINSSRFANDIPANEVSHWVAKVIFSTPPVVKETVNKVLVYFKPILEKYITDKESDQINCITALEQVYEKSNCLADCAKVLTFLYTKLEILNEESIISWYKDHASEEIKEQKTMKAFIFWLENAEEESD